MPGYASSAKGSKYHTCLPNSQVANGWAQKHADKDGLNGHKCHIPNPQWTTPCHTPYPLEFTGITHVLACMRRILIVSWTASHLGCLDWLCWDWERLLDSVNEQNWFVVLRNALVHQGTVSVLFNVSSESLTLLTPQSLAWLLTLDGPSCEP